MKTITDGRINDIRIQNARVFYNDQPIDAPDKLSVIVECIEKLVSASIEDRTTTDTPIIERNI